MPSVPNYIEQGGASTVIGGTLNITGQLQINGVDVTDAVAAALAGTALGGKIAAGQHETVAAADTVDTGLETVTAVVAVLDDDPGLDPLIDTATVGDQEGSPAAGSIIIKTWQATAAKDATPIAATTFSKKVNWIAFGT